MRKHVAPPESPATLSDLRDLANVSVRMALDAHRGRQLLSEKKDKLLVVLVALVFSLISTGFAYDTHSPMYFAALVTLLVATCWTVRFHYANRQFRKIRARFEDDMQQ